MSETLALIRESHLPRDLAESWQPIDLTAYRDAELPQPTIAGISYPGSLSLHYGEPGTVKTWLNLVLCLEQLRAGAASVWVDFEMQPTTITNRLCQLGATDDELARFAYVRPTVPIEDERTPRTIDKLLHEYKPTLCVIDAMAGLLALHEGDEFKGVDIERLYNGIVATLRLTGAAVHVIDHVAKDRDSRGRWPYGSQRKLGGADVGISVEMVTPFGRGRTGTAKLRVTKDRHGALPPIGGELHLPSDPLTGEVTYELSPTTDTKEHSGWKPTSLMDRVLQHVTHPFYEPESRSSLANAVSGKRAYVLQAIDCLIEDGQLRLEGHKVVPGYVPGTYLHNGNGNDVPVPPTYRGTGTGTTSKETT